MDNLVQEESYMEFFTKPIWVVQGSYSAGDTFYIAVQYNWNLYDYRSYPFQDFTLHVYSKQNLEVKDDRGKTNMWHMDGQYPSKF